MEKNLFDFNDYKAYLRAWIAGLPKRGRGFRLRIADAVGCQKAFVSQVLSGDAHFSLEQADRLSHFLAHDPEEMQYFLLLVQYARAGTKSLRDFFGQQLRAMTEKRLQLRNRLRSDREVSEEHKGRYYASWVNGAVRVALTVPRLRTREALAAHFMLPAEQVQEALHLLEESGLAERKGDSYFPTTNILHLGNDSPHIVRHHTNWRLRALDALGHEKPGDLHFSGIWSLSPADRKRIRTILVDCLDQSQRVAKDAQEEEELAVICVDLFSF